LVGGGGGGVSLSTTNVFTKNNSVTPFALTDGATISVDASQSNNFTVTLGGNRTLANPTNLTNGMVLNFRVTQDSTGSRTLAYGSKYKWALGGAGAAPTLNTTASTADFISCYYDSVLDVLHCALIGQAGPTGATGMNGTNGGGTANGVAGRLTLTTGVPVTTSDVTGATTVYWTPYKGNQIQLWDGSAWTTYTSAEISIALGTVTAALCYDVFMYQSGGTPMLEKLAWTDATTRATAVTLQDGRYCKSGDKTRLYLGTFYTTSTTTTEDSGGGTTTQVGGKRFLYNHYNRVMRAAHVLDTTDFWSYATDTWRQANAASGNKIEYVSGLSEDTVSAVLNVCMSVKGTTRSAKISIGLDSTSTPSKFITANYFDGASFSNTTSSVSYKELGGVGYHYLAWLEKGGAGTQSVFIGDDGGVMQCGMSADIIC
jgi:hypothetical protein